MTETTGTMTFVISIHAPVKGATVFDVPEMALDVDFNPRTREGCDLPGNRHAYRGYRHFNPRTREGCDSTSISSKTASICISIHAPVKGATMPAAPVRVRAS